MRHHKKGEHTVKKVGDMTVNDGNGLFDSDGLCDSIINDCNNALRHIASGQYIVFCSTMAQIAQKIVNLKAGIKNDIASKNNIIEELKTQNNRLYEELSGLPVEKEGECDNGND